MLSTKNLILKESDVPSYWVFAHYLKLNQDLTGQDIKLKSVWNPTERTASMCVYVDKMQSCYMFKDFSTGKGGDKITFVKELFSLSYGGAVEKIINDYNHFVRNHGIKKIEFKPEAKWEIELIKTRSWTEDDAKYWLQYRIGSTMLNKYNVKPIDYYNLIKQDDENLSKIKITSPTMYGYYDKSGNVYKIYQPHNKKRKFYKAFSHIQGIDQLEYQQPYLVITSSLKDVMCLDGFGYNIEVIAPDSENTLIKPYIIENLKGKYKKIITLFDNDEAGKAAIKKYKDIYSINGIYLDLSKDLSDSVKEFGFDKVHHELKSVLKETIHK